MTAPDNRQQPKALADLATYYAVQHQVEQQQIANQAAIGLALLWQLLPFANLDEATVPWLHSVTLQVEQKFRESEQAAYKFVQATKWSIEPTSDPLVKIDTRFPTAEVQLGMRVEGPIAVKRAMPAPERDAMARGKLNSTGVAVKHVANGGRGEVQALVAKDNSSRARGKPVIGWARFTDDKPCYFCGLLASQGAVYLSQNAFRASNARFVGDGNARVHDHCKCQLRPVYRAADKMDDRAKYFLKQWTNLDKSGLSPEDQIKEFRKVYVPPEPYVDAPPVDLNAVKANREALKTGLGASSPQVEFYDSAIRKLA